MKIASKTGHSICIGTPDSDSRLVLLHGWGADASDLIPIGKELVRIKGQKIEIVALEAPHLHPDGQGRQWYQLFPTDWSNVPLAVMELTAKITSLETVEIPLKRTIVLGFSQGGAMALASGCELPLAGVIACSAYPHQAWEPNLERPPILLTHGKQDEIVPFEALKILENKLLPGNSFLETREFEGGHEINFSLIEDIKIFVQKCFD